MPSRAPRPTKPCPRCGLLRQVRYDLPAPSLCRDCSVVVSPAEQRLVWAS